MQAECLPDILPCQPHTIYRFTPYHYGGLDNCAICLQLLQPPQSRLRHPSQLQHQSQLQQVHESSLVSVDYPFVLQPLDFPVSRFTLSVWPCTVLCSAPSATTYLLNPQLLVCSHNSRANVNSGACNYRCACHKHSRLLHPPLGQPLSVCLFARLFLQPENLSIVGDANNYLL